MATGDTPNYPRWIIDEARAMPEHVWQYVDPVQGWRIHAATTADTGCVPHTHMKHMKGGTMKYEVGQNVKIIGATHGWAAVRQGNIGIITDCHSGGGYTLRVPGVCDYWSCVDSDLEPLENATLVKCQLTNFMNRHKDNVECSIDDIRRQLKAYDKQLKSYMKELDMCATPNSKAFAQIKDNLHSISMAYPEFTFVTKPIVIKYFTRGAHKTVECEMGQYSVHCNVRPGATRMKIRGYSNTRNHGDSHNHPHVGSGHSPCLGTYQPRFDKLYKELDVIGIISLTLDFLSSCDRPGWYTSVLQWHNDMHPEHAYCQSCEHTIDNCHCCEHSEDEDENVCEHCGYVDDECECTRCPDNYDLLQDDAFPDAQCGRCTHLLRNEHSGRWECMYHGQPPHWSTELENFDMPEHADNRYQTQTV